jgi:hypothetical protein
VEDPHSAWAGGTSIDEPHCFRVQGPVTHVESDNVEAVHSVSRDPGNDFGRDLLIPHHLEEHGSANDPPRSAGVVP